MPLTTDPRQIEQLRVELTTQVVPGVLPNMPDQVGSSTFLPVVRQQLLTRFGVSGRAIDRAVTFYDLFAFGLLGIVGDDGTLSGTIVGGGPFIPLPGGALPPDDDVPPPAPTGFTAQGVFAANLLFWDAPDFSKVAYTEVWSNSVNNLGTAIKIGQATGFSYVDEVNDVGIAVYYWIRFVNSAPPQLVGAFNATLGTLAETGLINGVDLAPLIVSADKLSQGTYAGVNMCPNPGAEDGIVTWEEVQSSGSTAGCTFTATNTDKVGGSFSFLSTKATAAQDIGYGCQAIQVIPGETYGLNAQVRSNATGAHGLYVRIFESAVAPVGHYVTAANFASITDLLADGPQNTAWTPVAYQYTVPAGVFWITLSFLHWGSGGSTELFWDDVSFGRQITAEFLAAGSIAVGSAAIANGAIRNALIGNLAVDTANIALLAVNTGQIDNLAVTTAKIDSLAVTTAKIANLAVGDAQISDLSVGKLTAGSVAVSEYIQSTGFVTGVSGWQIAGNGNAEFGAATIRGQLTTGQIQVGAVTDTNVSGIAVRTITLTPGVNNETAPDLAVFSVTTSGSPLNVWSVLTFAFSGFGPAIDSLVISGVVLDSGTSTILGGVGAKLKMPADGVMSIGLAGIGRWATAGAATYAIIARFAIEAFDVTGAPVNLGAGVSFTYQAEVIAMENKV